MAKRKRSKSAIKRYAKKARKHAKKLLGAAMSKGYCALFPDMCKEN